MPRFNVLCARTYRVGRIPEGCVGTTVAFVLLLVNISVHYDRLFSVLLRFTYLDAYAFCAGTGAVGRGGGWVARAVTKKYVYTY